MGLTLSVATAGAVDGETGTMAGVVDCITKLMVIAVHHKTSLVDAASYITRVMVGAVPSKTRLRQVQYLV